MTPYERIRAMVNKESVDRPGASAWKHFHEEDRVVNDLVKRTIAFEEQNQWDFVKVMANGVYVQDQYGAEIQWSRDGIEFPATIRRVINSPRGFRDLKMVDVTTGPIHREVEVVKRLMDVYGGKVPVTATVFTPLTYAQELYNGWQNPYPFVDLVRYYGDDLKEGLKVLTELTSKIIEEFVKAGVDGFFYSTQFGNDLQMTPELYDEFAVSSDLEAFQPAVGNTWFNVLHIHGDSNLFFDKFLDYPFEAFNWQSTISNVTLKDAAEKTDKILIGGLEREYDFQIEDRDELKEHIRKLVKEAVASVPANRLILAPGCALPNDVPEFRFNVLREVVDELYD
ncbi:uroporphyrinogen decarboxylase family protein [Fusibacillus kribbianus]|uniref:Uroporphyrinogen decarboxylase family protein n=1 Tax=Fusibacillus kribbianus TaxID=3044208 RepID=A0AAP4BCW7_9FIRM|nr:uroporphyrinogen decarboxylase family protein [Ruminococcus sp. YH-rum2234]MDI9242748.1 uroporphyrinogen decarboxylase family protein [Ruminococcus sp. YH-rum2234]